MNLWNETKSVPISRPMVWEAYKKVKSNQGSAGVDQIGMEEFDAQRSKHLYKLWNRMASGSYCPPPVKEVEISKKDLSADSTKQEMLLIARRATDLATKIVLRTSITMTLEDQGNSKYRIKKAIKERAVEIKNEMPKILWD